MATSETIASEKLLRSDFMNSESVGMIHEGRITIAHQAAGTLLEVTQEKENSPLRRAQPLLSPCPHCGGSEGSAIESLFTYCTASIFGNNGSGFATPYFMICLP
jgi:hypothetical protein